MVYSTEPVAEVEEAEKLSVPGSSSPVSPDKSRSGSTSPKQASPKQGKKLQETNFRYCYTEHRFNIWLCIIIWSIV